MFGYYLRLALGFASFLLIAADTTAHDSCLRPLRALIFRPHFIR